MNKSLVFKNKLYLFCLLLISFFIFIYLVYSLINGERGLISFYKLKNQHNLYETTLVNLEEKNFILSDKIKRLKTNTLDLDFLDEKIRENTGYLYKNEILLNFD